MKPLKTIVGEVVLAGLSGTAIGGAVGFSVEAVREMGQEENKSEIGARVEADSRYVLTGTGWPKNKGAIYYGAAIGGALTLAIYAFKGNKKNVCGGEDSEGEEGEGKEL